MPGGVWPVSSGGRGRVTDQVPDAIDPRQPNVLGTNNQPASFSNFESNFLTEITTFKEGSTEFNNV